MKKKTLKKRIKKLKKSIKNRIRDAYYINKYYNEKVKENTVLLESKSGEDIAGNIFYIAKELKNSKYSNLKIYLSARKNKIEKLKEILLKYEINNIEIVKRMSFKYLKLLANAKYLFNDTSFPYMFIKKQGQVYTNTWHGTPLKCMGNDVPNRRYAMGNIKRNFIMADYLVYPNKEMEEKMISSYSLEQLYQGKILNAGYPRNAIFFNKTRGKELKKELKLEDKQMIVYMPTWRGLMTKRKKGEQAKDIIKKLKEVDEKLNDNQVFFVKMHVLVEKELDFSTFQHIRNFPKGYETYDVLNVADCLVTDYSSVFFDFANSRKKIVLFTYDKEEYISTRGLYYSLDELPFPKVDTPEELVEELNKEKEYNDDEFIKKFCTYDNKNADKELVKYVIGKEKSSLISEKETKKNGKDNVLIYSGSLALNGLTSSIISLMHTVDLDRENIFVTFREKTLKSNPLRLDKFSEKINVFPMINGYRYSVKDLIAYILFYKFSIKTKWINKQLDNLYKREIKRFFGFAKFDKAIHFTGYEKRIIGMFQRFEVPKAIFVHNDMIQEIKTRKNQHHLTLREAYRKYDRVVSVSLDIRNSIINISNREDNIVIVNNAHDYKNVLEKSEDEIVFDEKTKCNISLNVLNRIIEKKDVMKFINIARFSPEKGQKRLIDAFNKFYKENKNSFLIIIGGHGKLWDEINKYIKTLDCRYNVILIKYISNPFAILKKCDLFILSSFYESLGLVVLEAQTCGIPVISTNIGGPRGFMTEHGGRLVENTEEGILQGMNEFKAGKIKLMNFDPEKYNQKVKEEYEAIFENTKGENNVKSRNNNICKCS